MIGDPPASPAAGGGGTKPGPALDPKPGVYTIGTLVYTKAGLFMLFAWLLWGDFCFTLFESIGGPGILTLYLQDSFQVSNVQVNIIFNVIPQLIGVVVGPILSFKSDRHRGPRGRRIPFILWTTPFLCFFAAAIGFADDIIALTKVYVSPDSFISPFAVSMVVISFLVIGFSFFNEFVNTVFWYLFADVVPEKFMGRFLGLFRLVGAGAGFLLNVAIAEHQITHMRTIHIAVAVLYFVGFMMMCLRVKEGQYPPVTDVGEKTTFMQQVKLYFRECFTHPIFLLVYASSFAYVFARVGGSGVFGLHLGQHVADVQAHPAPVAALAASADGRLLLSAGKDGSVRRWSGEAQALPRPWYDAVHRGTLPAQRELAVQGSAALAAAMAPDGTWAAVADADGGIRVWSGEGQPAALTGHAGAVHALAVSSDGRRLASGGADGSVRLWSMPDGAPLRSIEGGAEVRSLAFARSGDRLAAGAIDGTVRVLDPEAGSETASWKAPGPVYALAFLPALRKAEPPALAASSVFDVPMAYLRDVFTNESLYELAGDRRSVITAADGWLAVGGQEDGDDSRNSRLRICNAADGSVVATMVGHKQAITSLAWKDDLRLLVSGSRDKSVRLWDPTRVDSLANDNAVRSISGYTDGVTGVAAQSQGPGVVSASQAGELHLWNVDAGISLRKVGIMASFFGIIGMILAYPLGALVDRFHALRITLWASIGLVPVPFISYFLVYDYQATAWLEVYKVPVFGIIGAAGIPLLISLFPKDKFGQMCSANGLIKQASQIVVGLLGAVFLDWLTRKTLLTENFRYGALWMGFGFILQAGIFYLIYREWKRLGGNAYQAPDTGTRRFAKVEPEVQPPTEEKS